MVRRPLPVGDLTADQQRLRGAITSGPRARLLASHEPGPDDWALPGPFGPMLLAPAVGDALQELGAAIRYRGHLPDDAREVAIVAVASVCRSTYELGHHLPLARAAGVGDTVLDAVVGGAQVTDTMLGTVVSVSRELATSGRADPALLDEVESALGPAATFELVVLAGYYRLLATILSAYDVE